MERIAVLRAMLLVLLAWLVLLPAGCEGDETIKTKDGERALTSSQPTPEFELEVLGQVVRGSRTMAQLQFELEGKTLVVPPGPGAVLIAKQKLPNVVLSRTFKKMIMISDASTKQPLGTLRFGRSTYAGQPDLVREQKIFSIDSSTGESRISSVRSWLTSGPGNTENYFWRWPAPDSGPGGVVP